MCLKVDKKLEMLEGSLTESINSFEMFGDGMAVDAVKTVTDKVSHPVRNIHLRVRVFIRTEQVQRSSVKQTLRPQTPPSVEVSTVDFSVEIAVEDRDLEPVKVGYILETETMRARIPIPFANREVVIEDSTVEFRLDNPELDMAGLETLGNDLVKSLLDLSTEIKCTTHAFAEEKYDSALSHFAYYCRKFKTIKVYKEEEFSLLFAYTSENDENVVRQHVDIISDQQVIQDEIPLDDDKVCVIQGTGVDMSLICPASVTLQDDELRITGVQEDAATSKLQLHKMLSKMIIRSQVMEPYAMKLLERDHIKRSINDLLRKKKLQWCVKDQTVYVLGDKATLVEVGVADVKDFFRKVTVNVTRQERTSRGWDRCVKTLKIQCGDEIDVDDSDGGRVCIAVTATQHSVVVQHVEEKKCTWTLTNKRVPLKAGTCEFVMKHLKAEIMNETDHVFLKINQSSDGTTIELGGTEAEVKLVCDAIQAIGRAVSGVPNARADDFLKECEKNKVVMAGITTTKTQHDIIVKEGRIEDEDVDVIVNSTAYSLSLKQADSAVTTAIFAKAGPRAQESIKDKVAALAHDHMVDGEPGNLQCKRIYHLALDEYNESQKQKRQETLAKVVGDCLRKASKDGYKTISFPAICTGILKYPCKMVAKVMLEEMVKLFNQDKLKNITIIYIVIPKDDKTTKGEGKKQIFEEEINRLKQEAEKVEHCLVDESPWIYHSRCNLLLRTGNDKDHTVRTLNGDFKEQTKPKVLIEHIQ